jgi:hypothetical protein
MHGLLNTHPDAESGRSTFAPFFTLAKGQHVMRSLTFLATAMLALPVFAQEKSSWIASRFSSDIMEITPSGSVLSRIDMGVNLRAAQVNPVDGRIWALQIFSANFYIVDPATAAISGPFTNTGGSGYGIAFDAAGHAWMPGGTDVVEFDQAGAVVNTYALGVAAPLGISIDNNNNKWIAHRQVAGSVSRVDAAGLVTNYPVSGGNPVGCIADFRLGSDSHIWVSCDDGGALLELDQTGTELNNYTMPSATIGGIGPVFTDFIISGVPGAGRIWVGSYSGAGLYEFDPYANGVGPNDGAVVNTYTIPSSSGSYMGINGLSVDTLGRLLCTQRVTFSGVGPPCEVQRVNPTTGAIEVPIVLASGGINAAGSQTAVSSSYQWSLVVAPFADTDLDGDANQTETLAGTAALDATSDSVFSVDTTGTSQIGSTVSINVQGSSAWALGFSDGLMSPGVAVPGFLGNLMLTNLITTIGGSGAASTLLALPINAALQGQEVHIQGVIVTPALQLEFRNVTGIVIW